MARLKLSMSINDMFIKMSEGNPGALTVLLELFNNDPKVDPDSFLLNYGSIFLLDTFEIYGVSIYILWNDICGGDIIKVICLLRAAQLGIISSVLLKDACLRQDGSGTCMIDIGNAYMQVKKQLPSFDSGK